MSNIFNILVEDTSKLESLVKKAPTVFEQQLLSKIQEISQSKVHRTSKCSDEVIALASTVSNMEILLSEAGQSFTLSEVRTQPDYGAGEVAWVTNKLKKHIPAKLLRRAVNHLITGSEMTMNRDVFLDVMRASVFVVDHVSSLQHLVGYAIAFGCKSVYELSDKFNFHVIRQDYSSDAVRWFYNNTISLQRTVV